jgi:putative spermidine/putrescine transport system substrate-binding protein
MERRAFLVGAGSLALAQLTSSCSNGNRAALKVRLLRDSIPAQLVGEFRRGLQQSATVKFDPAKQIDELFKNLKAWKQQAEKKDAQSQLPLPFIGSKTPAIADLVTLGDYWLETAIAQQLIQPLKLDDLTGWQQLPPRWQEIVRRNNQGQVTKSGSIWGAPYRWGTTVIAYNREKFKELGWTPKDWSDLWRPELRDRISLLDQPREVIGLALKKLGASYNTTNLQQVPNLKKELLALHQQVKFYSSSHYLQPLVLGDTYVAVGWSTDILPLRTTYREIEAVVPVSGTALWADIWVQPASVTTESNLEETGNRQALMNQWIDYCWQSKPAREISLFTNATSPILTGITPTDLPKDLRENPLRLPAPSVLAKSEFLRPLPKSALAQYESLWKEIRLSKADPASS